MKNKKFMLLAVGAMAVVALGTAGVGTAAWFTAGQAAPQGAAGSTGSITAKESEASLGQWTVTVTPHIDNANIVLTKDQANAATPTASAVSFNSYFFSAPYILSLPGLVLPQHETSSATFLFAFV